MNVEPRQDASTSAVASFTDAQLAHLVLRVTLGLNMAAHGAVRVGHVSDFAAALVRDFSATVLPSWSVSAFATVLPFAELAIGVGILAGVRLRATLTAGGLLLAALMFGSCLRQAWEIVGIQLIYALTYYVLLTRAADARLVLGRPR